MNTLLKNALILITVSIALIINGHAQPTPPSPDAKMLSGHEQKSESAIRESTDIVIAAFTAIGYPGPDADGESDYDQAEIEIVSALKGTLSGKLKAFYIVYAMPGKDQENPPVLGTQYIMFIKKLGPKEHKIIKLLPATDENITKVKAVIAAAPAGK